MSELENESEKGKNTEKISEVVPVSGLYENWFLEYASYVILERAVPAIEDGLKPVQRRILHAMKEMDDGRFNKVANIIGSTMQYHPHGDASIGDAIVGLGQKDLLIDCQGNWGDIRTGDSAAAPRYIEARLSKFALEVGFNPDITEWQASYDGRKKEPVTLPVKFPLLLAQGVEGIAVGLATKVLPHNFIELLEASIKILKNEPFVLFPDFSTGGSIDVSDYKDGLKGGRIRVRAKIEELDKKTLVIREIPFGVTTGALIESIVKANEAGKIKIKKVIDNTAKEVEIEVQLQPGVSPDITIDALYAFTDCEVSISPNACVILDNKPRFLGVSEILKYCTFRTKDLLKRELEIKRAELMEKIFFGSLLKIFIQEGMYKNKEYENAGNAEACYLVLNNLFEPFFKLFYRRIENEDYAKLIAKPLSSITRFDVAKSDEQMRALEQEIKQVDHDLAHLNDFTIAYFQNLIQKYGKGRERKTVIKQFDTINANIVAAANEKLYVNRAEGFIGTALKKDEYVCDCSDIDDIIVFKKDGNFKVVKVGPKVFVGKDILHVAVFRKDDRTVYNMIYTDGKSGKSMVKRFQIGGITRDKDYDLTQGNKGSKVIYLAARPNGESEIVTITLTPSSAAKNKVFDYNFADLLIKGRSSQGNILTIYPVKSVKFKALGDSSLGGTDIYYDENLGRLNTDSRGKYLGNFDTEDRIIVIYKTGEYEITNFELTNKYDSSQILHIEKFNPETIWSVVHYVGEDKTYYVKRFKIEQTTLDKKYLFISDSKNSKLLVCTSLENPEVEVHFKAINNKKGYSTKVSLKQYIDVKGWKAIGNKLSGAELESITLLKPKVEKEKDLSPSLFDEPNDLSNQNNESYNEEVEGLKPGDSLEIKF
jgi:topoisomerase-4 subunit A